MLILQVYLLATIFGIWAAPIVEPERADDILDLDDAQLEEELRRRSLGGPWEAEQAVSILNEALDKINSPNKTHRPRRFDHQATAILSLLTGIEDPSITTDTDDSTNPDWIDNPIETSSGHTQSLTTIRKIIDMLDGTNGQPRRSLESVERLYPWFDRSRLPSFKARLAGRRGDLLVGLNKFVLMEFKEARQKNQPIHGRMIQRWAIQKASQIGISNFKASTYWLHHFKRRNGIVSRKVTNYLGRAEQDRAPLIAASMTKFADDYVRASTPYARQHVWNFDQTGFNYEPANLRTLSFKGERDTTILLDNKNKNTHSYTVLPIISRGGKLFPKFAIVLQEANGVFGPKVIEKVRQLEAEFGNIQVFSSKSGKFNAELMAEWYNTTLRSAIEVVRRSKMIEDQDERAVLVLADDWNGHSSNAQEDRLKTIGAQLLKIPPSTTSRLQPLDVNFNRQFKILYNRIFEEAFYQDKVRPLATREGILNLQSLLHDQFSSPLYRDMLLFAWRNTDPTFNATAEMTNVPPKMVAHIQFDFDNAATCQALGCENHAFLRCSHCGRLMCLDHFLKRTCFHQQRRTKRSTETCPVGSTQSTDATDGEDYEEYDGEFESTTTNTPEIQKLKDFETTAVTIANATGFGPLLTGKADKDDIVEAIGSGNPLLMASAFGAALGIYRGLAPHAGIYTEAPTASAAVPKANSRNKQEGSQESGLPIDPSLVTMLTSDGNKPTTPSPSAITSKPKRKRRKGSRRRMRRPKVTGPKIPVAPKVARPKLRIG